jgi:hypothetical protein
VGNKLDDVDGIDIVENIELFRKTANKICRFCDDGILI